MESYCSKIHDLSTTSSSFIIFSKASWLEISGKSARVLPAILAKYSGSFTGRSKIGACSLTGWTGISATFSPCQNNSICPVSVTSPITSASKSHLRKISKTLSSIPFLAQMSILSWDSLSINS